MMQIAPSRRGLAGAPGASVAASALGLALPGKRDHGQPARSEAVQKLNADPCAQSG